MTIRTLEVCGPKRTVIELLGLTANGASFEIPAGYVVEYILAEYTGTQPPGGPFDLTFSTTPTHSGSILSISMQSGDRVKYDDVEGVPFSSTNPTTLYVTDAGNGWGTFEVDLWVMLGQFTE